MNITVLNPLDILMIWSFAMLYLLWRTNSIKKSVSTTSILLAVNTVGVLHYFDCVKTGIFILIFVVSALVWRVIPQGYNDEWHRYDSN